MDEMITTIPAQNPTVEQPAVEFRYQGEFHEFESADQAYAWLCDEERHLDIWIEQERRDIEERQRNFEMVRRQRLQVAALRRNVAPHL